MLVLVLLLAGAGACSDDEDVLGEQACLDFYELTRDLEDGVVPPSDLVPRLREVQESARYAETPGLAPASQAMLAAAIDGEASAAGMNRMVQVCGDLLDN